MNEYFKNSFIGKKIKDIDIDNFGIEITLEDNSKFDYCLKETEYTIKKIKQIVDIYNNTSGEFATLPNGEEICISDNEPIIAYLQEILEEEN